MKSLLALFATFALNTSISHSKDSKDKLVSYGNISVGEVFASSIAAKDCIGWSLAEPSIVSDEKLIDICRSIALKSAKGEDLKATLQGIAWQKSNRRIWVLTVAFSIETSTGRPYRTEHYILPNGVVCELR